MLIAKIGDEAFRKCINLKNINLPSGLKEIGNRAFLECESLEEIIIPKTVTKWGMEAFFGTSLSSITFEDGIETIGSYACFWCEDKLTSITFPASVKEIGEYTFNGKLAEVRFLGNAPEKLGDHPFHENTVIYFDKNTSGWENTQLKEYKLIAQ